VAILSKPQTCGVRTQPWSLFSGVQGACFAETKPLEFGMSENVCLNCPVICIVHEWKDREIDAFTKDYWGGEIYFDESKAFYAAVHGGTIKKGSMLSMLNPFSKAWKNIREVSKRGLVTDHNMEGDGATLGGLAVLDSPNGNAVYTFEEKAFGDKASMEDIFKAVGSLYK